MVSYQLCADNSNCTSMLLNSLPLFRFFFLTLPMCSKSHDGSPLPLWTKYFFSPNPTLLPTFSFCVYNFISLPVPQAYKLGVIFNSLFFSSLPSISRCSQNVTTSPAKLISKRPLHCHYRKSWFVLWFSFAWTTIKFHLSLPDCSLESNIQQLK